MELTFVLLKGMITVKLGLIKVTLNCWNRWICNSVFMMTPKHQRVIKVYYLGSLWASQGLIGENRKEMFKRSLCSNFALMR